VRFEVLVAVLLQIQVHLDMNIKFLCLIQTTLLLKQNCYEKLQGHITFAKFVCYLQSKKECFVCLLCLSVHLYHGSNYRTVCAITSKSCWVFPVWLKSVKCSGHCLFLHIS